MIDEIPIIGVTEWTVDGLAAKEFRRRPKDAAESPGTGNLNSWSARYFRLERVG